MKLENMNEPQSKGKKAVSTALSLILGTLLLLAAGIPSYSMARGLATLIAEDNDHVYIITSEQDAAPIPQIAVEAAQ